MSRAETPTGIQRKVIAVSIAAALGGFLFGFDTAVINGAVDALAGNVSGFDLGVGLKGFAVSSALIGCAVGAWFAGPIANRRGRIPVMVVAADTDTEREAGVAGMRARLAFYGSTHAYRIVLDTHGWGDLQTELNTLSKRGDWSTMSSLITDEMLDELCVVAPRRELPKVIRARYGDLVQRVAFDIPDAELIAELKEG